MSALRVTVSKVAAQRAVPLAHLPRMSVAGRANRGVRAAPRSAGRINHRGHPRPAHLHRERRDGALVVLLGMLDAVRVHPRRGHHDVHGKARSLRRRAPRSSMVADLSKCSGAPAAVSDRLGRRRDRSQHSPDSPLVTAPVARNRSRAGDFASRVPSVSSGRGISCSARAASSDDRAKLRTRVG